MHSGERPPYRRPVHKDIIKLLRSIFEISNQHRWVSDFLFTPDVLPVADVVSNLQISSGVIASLNIKSSSGRFKSLLSDQFALIPVFSNGNITTGVLVKKRDSGASSSKSRNSVMVKARVAFDNKNTYFLTVCVPSNSGIIQVTYLSYHVQHGMEHAQLEFNEQIFRKSIHDAKVSAPLLLNSLGKCDFFFEERTNCIVCSRKNNRKCRCTHNVFLPQHPLDFSYFAPNLVLFCGDYQLQKVSWHRSSKGLVTEGSMSEVKCQISISVDETQILNICRHTS